MCPRHFVPTINGVCPQCAPVPSLRVTLALELFARTARPGWTAWGLEAPVEAARIDASVDGRPLSKSAQVRMCGNSVCPPLAAAIVTANFAEQAATAPGRVG